MSKRDGEDSTTEMDYEGGEEHKMSATGISAKQAMKNHQLKKKKMAQQAFAAKLLRIGVLPSEALNYKKQQVVLAVGQERNRIIDRDELQKLREKNRGEGPVSKILERMGPAKPDKTPKKSEPTEEESSHNIGH